MFFQFFKGFWIKNILSGRKKNDFLDIKRDSKQNFVARVSIQFYPSGKATLMNIRILLANTKYLHP